MYACLSLPVTFTLCGPFAAKIHRKDAEYPEVAQRKGSRGYSRMNTNKTKQFTQRRQEARAQSCRNLRGYFLLTSLDGEARALVTFSRRMTRSAWRVSICVRPPGTSARTIACPMRGGMVTPPWPRAYSLSHQLGTNFPLKRRNPSKL